MSNEEAIEILKNPSRVKCYVLDKAISLAILALQEQAKKEEVSDKEVE